MPTLCMLYVSRPVLNQKSVMVLSTYAKQRIITLHGQGYRSPTITKLLKEEGLRASRVAVHKFLRKYQATSTIRRREGSGRPSKITPGIRRLVNERMEKDDETTATQLHQMLIEHGTLISLQTILRCRSALGWTFRGSAYCQLIRHVNKEKRLAWAREFRGEADAGFHDVIWSDESSIQLESHKRFCCRKQGCPPKCKPRYICICKAVLYNYTVLQIIVQNAICHCNSNLDLPYVYAIQYVY